MRNWISDKFGRNRIRTRAPNTVPNNTHAPTAPIVYVTSARDGVQYWYRNGYNTVTFMSNPRSQGSNWVTQCYANPHLEYIWWDELAPTYPKYLRLPDGA